MSAQYVELKADSQEFEKQKIAKLIQSVSLHLQNQYVQTDGERKASVQYELYQSHACITIAIQALSKNQIKILRKFKVKTFPENSEFQQKFMLFPHIFNDSEILKHFALFGSSSGIQKLKEEIVRRQIASGSLQNSFGVFIIALMFIFIFSMAGLGAASVSMTAPIALFVWVPQFIFFCATFVFLAIYAYVQNYRDHHLLDTEKKTSQTLAWIGLIILSTSFLVFFLAPSVTLLGVSFAPVILGCSLSAICFISAIMDYYLNKPIVLANISFNDSPQLQPIISRRSISENDLPSVSSKVNAEILQENLNRLDDEKTVPQKTSDHKNSQFHLSQTAVLFPAPRIEMVGIPNHQTQLNPQGKINFNDENATEDYSPRL